MGGFGAFQLGCFAPDVFDAVVSVAGYGLGTSEPNSGYGAPQPVSGAMVFQALQPVLMCFELVFKEFSSRNERMMYCICILQVPKGVSSRCSSS